MTLYGKWCDSVKDLESSQLFWIVLVDPKCNHMYLYKREAEEVLTQLHTGEGNAKRKAEVGVMRPQAKDTRSHQKLGDARNILEGLGGSVVLPVL